MLKKLFLAISFTMFFTINVFANDISVYILGDKVSFEEPPIIEDGRILVPVREIFEELGLILLYDPNTRIITAYDNENEIKLQINNLVASVNSNFVELDVPAKIINDRTYVPLRFVSEATGLKTTWSTERSAAIIDIEEVDPDVFFNDKYVAVEPIAEPITQPVTDPIAEPVTQPVTDPINVPAPIPSIASGEKGAFDNPYLLNETIMIDTSRDAKEVTFVEGIRGEKAEIIMQMLRVDTTKADDQEYFLTKLKIKAIQSNIPEETPFISLPVLKYSKNGIDENMRFVYSETGFDDLNKIPEGQELEVWVAQLVDINSDIIIKNICEDSVNYIKLNADDLTMRHSFADYSGFLDHIRFDSMAEADLLEEFNYSIEDDVIIILSDCINMLRAEGYQFMIYEGRALFFRTGHSVATMVWLDITDEALEINSYFFYL